MLNPVGIVDAGRISTDTGHMFGASKEAAPGIAARYYMNRNFYISDPDAFTVSRQMVSDQEWHGGKRSLTLDEAKVSIALSAISGGMYEIGDDLPTLGLDRDRVALVENRDLINMALLGKASRPLDLMSYAPEDTMPSLFFLKESQRQSIFTVFNWTESPRTHNFTFAELGLPVEGNYQVFDVFEGSASSDARPDGIRVTPPPHSVRIFKIVDATVPVSPPSVQASIPTETEAGKLAVFSARLKNNSFPAVSYHWDFGDGTAADGAVVTHAYTQEASFTVKLRAEGVDGMAFEKSSALTVTGAIDTLFTPANKQRSREK